MAYNVYYACDECGRIGGTWCECYVGICYARRHARTRGWSIGKRGWICPACKETLKKQRRSNNEHRDQ